MAPWPDQPFYERLPGWSLILAAALRIAPGASPEAASRLTNVFCLALAGTLLGALSRRFGASPRLSLAVGLAISLSPSMVYLSVTGFSEVSFVLVIALGLTLIFSQRRLTFLGSLVIGTGVLIRANFVLFPLALLAIVLVWQTPRRQLLVGHNLFRGALAGILFMLPTLLWLTRNYSVTGRFPVLSAIEGETLYGANNDLVANDLGAWGYWVIPDQIPGETSKLQLARKLPNALALNDYYHHQATTWIKHHLSAMPRLTLGKFVRAFAPVPWNLSPVSALAFATRFAIYLFAALLLRHWWRRIDQRYLLFLGSMSLVHLATTTVYYGQFRFSHCFLEIFLVPCIFIGLQNWFASRHRLVSLKTVPIADARRGRSKSLHTNSGAL